MKKRSLKRVDWKEYLDFYPDLRLAGIDTEKKAKKHWLEYGDKEGRFLFTEQLMEEMRDLNSRFGNLLRYQKQNHNSFRSEIINLLIKKNDYKKYLEIGVFRASLNFDKIKIDSKIGVDPGSEGYSEATYTMTSDQFFEQSEDTFDIVFCDGLHHADQVYKDIVNSLSYLNDGGVVVCHDMNPLKEEYQSVIRSSDIWNGDCWKAFVKLRMERDDLQMYVVDADYGIGIIKKGGQVKLGVEDLTYDNLEKNRERWLNLTPIKEFLGNHA